MMRRLPKREGFTLIEMLMVIVIIGILASIVVNSFWKVKSRGFEASLQQDLRNAALQQELYFNTNHIYASLQSDLSDFHPSNGVTLTVNYATQGGWAGVTTHQSVPNRYCGYFTGDAAASDAGPATKLGVVTCGDR